MSTNKRLIIGICGESGAGKTTSTSILQEAGFSPYSLSGFLRQEAEATQDKPIRRQVQAHGQAMNAQHGNAYYAELMIKNTDILERDRAVVDGFRNHEELTFLRTKAAERGSIVQLVAVILDAENRFVRVQGRARLGDPQQRAQFKSDDERANGSEGTYQNNKTLIDFADYRIKNKGCMDELRLNLSKTVESILDSTSGR
jgi:dephospho-CoA kinase